MSPKIKPILLPWLRTLLANGTIEGLGVRDEMLASTHKPLSSSVLRDYLIGFYNINHKKELLRGLWVRG